MAIVGAGFGGITAAARLLQSGIEDFLIFERADGPGGTWRVNSYPGAEVDTHSALFSLQFRNFAWSRTHARQPEVLAYLESTIDELGIGDRCRFGRTIRRAVWDETRHEYAVESHRGPEGHFDAVITAVGLFSEINVPNWPGLARFRGPKFHTASWDSSVNLGGKRIAVVGTGASAVQVVPSIAPLVDHLYVFQREPGWILPKADRDFDPDERERRARPRAQLLERLRLLFFYDFHWSRAWYPKSRASAQWKRMGLDFLSRVFKDRPDLKAALTPNYPILGKRILFTDAFYPSLLRSNVELVPHAVTRVTEDGLVDDKGVERKVDVLVMATGFRPADFLASLEVVGRGGQTLREHWAGEPTAFLGITVAGFPNFYMLYGPNTNGGTIAFNLDCQAQFAARSIAGMAQRRNTAVEVRPAFVEIYNRWLQRQIAGTSMLLANNYFKSASGRVVTNFPYRVSLYWAMTRVLRRVSSVERRLQHQPSDRNGLEVAIPNGAHPHRDGGLDPQVRAWLDARASVPAKPYWELSPEQARASSRALRQLSVPPMTPVANVRELLVPGPAGSIPVRAYWPVTTVPLPALAYFHSGGWVVGDLGSCEEVCRRLATEVHCLVVAPEYRLAPEHRWPAAADDCWAVTEQLLNGTIVLPVDPGRVAVSGDSAGGNLAAAIALRARSAGVRLVLQQLVNPVLDADFDTESYRRLGAGFGLDAKTMRWFWDQYVPDPADRLDPDAAPLRAADLSGLAPAHVVVGGFDLLRDEAVAYAERLRAHGVHVVVSDYAGLNHGAISQIGVVDQAARVAAEMCEQVRAAFAAASGVAER